MAEKLDFMVVENQLEQFPDWFLDENAICREWQFGDFKEALNFINLVARVAEEVNHHPEIRNIYNKVTLRLTTHEAGGITKKDFQTARRIDQIDTKG